MKVSFIAIDETEYLSEDCKLKTGTYETIYAFNPEEHVHCCSLTPSYWLEAVDFRTEHHLDDDLHDDLSICLYESSGYYNCQSIDKSKEIITGEYETFEDALEYARCNAVM